MSALLAEHDADAKKAFRKVRIPGLTPIFAVYRPICPAQGDMCPTPGICDIITTESAQGSCPSRCPRVSFEVPLRTSFDFNPKLDQIRVRSSIYSSATERATRCASPH